MSHTLKMLCIGTATQDVFLVGGKLFKPELEEDGKYYEQLPLGAKLDLEEVVFATGGNASNAAVTFARQHLDSTFIGVVGTEPSAEFILRELDDEGVNTKHVRQNERYKTGYATILLAPNGERTILRYHGDTLRSDGSDLDLDAIHTADWLYVSSVGSMTLLEKVISIAARNGVQVAINPSSMEIQHPDKLRTLLDDVAVLITNKEEMQQLVEGKSTEELVRHAGQLVRTVLVSDGPRGAIATDGHILVKAGMYEDVKVIDRLGAGDAFGSGFVAMHAQGKSLEEAITFASANSTSVVGVIGAKPGILHKGAKIHEMPLEVKPL